VTLRLIFCWLKKFLGDKKKESGMQLKQFRLFDWIIGSLFAVGLIWFWRGFWFPDPYALEHWKRLAWLIMWAGRVGIPLGGFGLGWLYWRIRTGKTDPKNIGLAFGIFILLGLMAFPFLEGFYHRGMDMRHRAAEYHPYLQLAPVLPDSAAESQPHLCVMCLGGSTTEFRDGSGRDWPGRVEERLKRALARDDVRVHNLGRQWYTTQHTLINYEANLRKWKPDVVIVMHTINDLLHNADFSYLSHGPFREDYGHFYGPVNRIVTNRSLPDAALEMFGHFWYFKRRLVVDQTDFPGLVPFERNLNTLIDLVKLDGSGMILMTQPSLYRKDLSDLEKQALEMLRFEAIGPDSEWSFETPLRGFKVYGDAVRRIAMERNVQLIDLDKAVPKDLDHFRDDVHYQDGSFDLVADKVSEGILKSGYLENKNAGKTN
jgi:hypothetical protein